tara:strand:- start:28 stop:648 length:621 start_codon:yes stop_codon:yes gene_type:complete
MRLFASSVVLAAALVLYGCDSEPTDTNAADANVGASSAENETADGADDLLHETGLVTHVEDNGYPTYTFTIQFRADQPGFDLTANVAELDLGDASPESFTGKTVSVDYVSGEEPNLMDMRASDRSVLGSDAPEETDPNWKNITGTLSGAEAVVGGDLPDEITVTAADGQKLTFKTYVNAEMVPANGKTVTALYGTRYFNRIVRLQP